MTRLRALKINFTSPLPVWIGICVVIFLTGCSWLNPAPAEDGDSGGNLDTEASGDGDGDSDGDGDGDSDGDTDTDADTETDADTDTDSDLDTESDPDSEQLIETDSELETDTEDTAETDTGDEVLPPLYGLKVYDIPWEVEEIEAAVQKMADLQINTVFIDFYLSENAEFVQFLKDQNIAVYVLFPVYLNHDALLADPDLCAVNPEGVCAEQDWLKLVCPSRYAYRQDVVKRVETLIETVDPAGISIDFIRHFIFWETVYPDASSDDFEQTCFCDSCVHEFGEYTGVSVADDFESIEERSNWILAEHEAEWHSWKTHVITTMVAEIVAGAKTQNPDVKINLHAVPWRQSDFDSAILWTVGQDFAALGQYLDYLSPMTYGPLIGREPTWISSVTAELSELSGAMVVPSVQVSEEGFSTSDFELSIHEALKEPSGGVVFWNWSNLDWDPERYDVVQEVLSDLTR